MSGGVVRRRDSGHYLWANSFHGWSSTFSDVSGLNNVPAWAFETSILGSCCISKHSHPSGADTITHIGLH